MSGVEPTESGLVVDREPNRFDELTIALSALASRLDTDHVFVAGYVVILTGRSRATEDIDVFIEPCSESEIDAVIHELEAADYCGPAVPLSEMYDNLASGTNICIAPAGEMSPRLEVTFLGDEFDRASLSNAISATIDGETIPIGPLELQIAYKLALGGRTDLEAAAHLYTLFGETLSTARLEK